MEWPAYDGNDDPKPDDEPRTTGLAFSGGGIRSASFCSGVLCRLMSHSKDLGVKQAALPDYISCVSGGGYLGSSFSHWRHSHNRHEKATVDDWFWEYLQNFEDKVGYWVRGNNRWGICDLLTLILLLGIFAILVLVVILPMAFPIALIVDEIMGDILRQTCPGCWNLSDYIYTSMFILMFLGVNLFKVSLNAFPDHRIVTNMNILCSYLAYILFSIQVIVWMAEANAYFWRSFDEVATILISLGLLISMIFGGPLVKRLLFGISLLAVYSKIVEWRLFSEPSLVTACHDFCDIELLGYTDHTSLTDVMGEYSFEKQFNGKPSYKNANFSMFYSKETYAWTISTTLGNEAKRVAFVVSDTLSPEKTDKHTHGSAVWNIKMSKGTTFVNETDIYVRCKPAVCIEGRWEMNDTKNSFQLYQKGDAVILAENASANRRIGSLHNRDIKFGMDIGELIDNGTIAWENGSYATFEERFCEGVPTACVGGYWIDNCTNEALEIIQIGDEAIIQSTRKWAPADADVYKRVIEVDFVGDLETAIMETSLSPEGLFSDTLYFTDDCIWKRETSTCSEVGVSVCSEVDYQYRLIISRVRKQNNDDIPVGTPKKVHLSELELFSNGTKLSIVMIKESYHQGSDSREDEAEDDLKKLFDDGLGTTWTTTFYNQVTLLIYVCTSQIVNEYELYTASDDPDADPVSWVFGQMVGLMEFSVTDIQSNLDAPDSRFSSYELTIYNDHIDRPCDELPTCYDCENVSDFKDCIYGTHELCIYRKNQTAYLEYESFCPCIVRLCQDFDGEGNCCILTEDRIEPDKEFNIFEFPCPGNEDISSIFVPPQCGVTIYETGGSPDFLRVERTITTNSTNFGWFNAPDFFRDDSANGIIISAAPGRTFEFQTHPPTEAPSGEQGGRPKECEGINNGCCTLETPCELGDGDCDSDLECRDDLVCHTCVLAEEGLPTDSQNGWDTTDDCCVPDESCHGFTCDVDVCIDIGWICDDEFDCVDESDEDADMCGTQQHRMCFYTIFGQRVMFSRDTWNSCYVVAAVLLMIYPITGRFKNNYIHFLYRWRLQSSFYDRTNETGELCGCGGLPGLFFLGWLCCCVSDGTKLRDVQDSGRAKLIASTTVNRWDTNEKPPLRGEADGIQLVLSFHKPTSAHNVTRRKPFDVFALRNDGWHRIDETPNSFDQAYPMQLSEAMTISAAAVSLGMGDYELNPGVRNAQALLGFSMGRTVAAFPNKAMIAFSLFVNMLLFFPVLLAIFFLHEEKNSETVAIVMFLWFILISSCATPFWFRAQDKGGKLNQLPIAMFFQEALNVVYRSEDYTFRKPPDNHHKVESTDILRLSKLNPFTEGVIKYTLVSCNKGVHDTDIALQDLEGEEYTAPIELADYFIEKTKVLELVVWVETEEGEVNIFHGETAQYLHRTHSRDEPPFLSLSDGGHSENLATLPLLALRLDKIIICDGSADPTEECEDLFKTLSRARDQLNCSFFPIDSRTDIERALMNDFVTHKGSDGPRTFRFRVLYTTKEDFTNITDGDSEESKGNKAPMEGEKWGEIIYLKGRAGNMFQDNEIQGTWATEEELWNEPLVKGTRKHHIHERREFGSADASTLYGMCCNCCHSSSFCPLELCCGKFPHHSTANQFFTTSMFKAYHETGFRALSEAFVKGFLLVKHDVAPALRSATFHRDYDEPSVTVSVSQEERSRLLPDRERRVIAGEVHNEEEEDSKYSCEV